MNNKVAAGLLSVAFAALCASAHGADPPPAIKYRQATMRALGGHMSAAAAIIKGEVDQRDHLSAHFEGLSATAKMTKDLFPAGSDKGQTDALPAVWEKAADFKKAVGAADAATRRLDLAVKSMDPGTYRPAFDEMGKACKGCHDGFRKKQP